MATVLIDKGAAEAVNAPAPAEPGQADPETVTTYTVRGLEPDGTGVLVLEGP